MATISRMTYFPDADAVMAKGKAVMQQISTADDATTTKATSFDVKKWVILLILAWVALKIVGQVFDGNGVQDNADIKMGVYNIAVITLTVMVFIPLIKFFFARYYVAGASEYSALI